MNNNVPQQIRENDLEEFPGRRRNCRAWQYNNNVYHLDNRHNPVYRCAHPGIHCPANIQYDDHNNLWLLVAHNHEPDIVACNELKMRLAISRLAEDPYGLSPTQIWERTADR